MSNRFVDMIEETDHSDKEAVKKIVLAMHDEILAISKSKNRRMRAWDALWIFARRYDMNEDEVKRYLSPSIRAQITEELTYANTLIRVEQDKKDKKSNAESTHNERTHNCDRT